MTLTHCFECGNPLAPTTNGSARRFCSAKCRQTFGNRAGVNGAPFYHLIRAWRRERSKAKKLGLWNAICQLELYFNDMDVKLGKRTYLPPELVLADIERFDMRPSTNLYIKEGT